MDSTTSLERSSAPARAGHVPRWLRLALCTLLFAYPGLWLQYIAGDTVIHLVFAETAADGHFFDYNPGESCAGETSPGYMLLLAGAQVVLGQGALVLFVKALGFASWYSLLFVVFRVTRQLLASSSEVWAWAVVATVGLMPGSVANAVLGMENVVFALWFWCWLWCALHHRWFVSARAGAGVEFGLGAALGFASWLRPEALPLALVAVAVRAWSLRGLAIVRPTAWFTTGVGLGNAGLWAFTLLTLGHSPYGAGAARVQESADLWLGTLPVSFRFSARLLAYGCFTLPALVSFVASLRRLAFRTRVTAPSSALEALDGLAVQTLAFVVLFSTVFPSVHLARYTLFLWPMLAIHGARGLQLLAPRFGHLLAARALVALGCVLGFVYAYETRVRLGMARGHTVSEVRAAYENRTQRTSELLASMGEPARSTVVVGVVEAQLRYFVDSRITVRSLDGLLDERMKQFTHFGQIDTLGYLKDRNVEYLLEHPDALSTRRFSYSALRALPPGAQVTIEGVSFTSIGPDVTRVTRATRS